MYPVGMRNLSSHDKEIRRIILILFSFVLIAIGIGYFINHALKPSGENHFTGIVTNIDSDVYEIRIDEEYTEKIETLGQTVSVNLTDIYNARYDADIKVGDSVRILYNDIDSKTKKISLVVGLYQTD